MIYRERLRRLGPSFPIPTPDEEEQDRAGFDVKIGAAMDEVRRRAKEKGTKAVHRENINYGAARNAYGLKPYGLGACLIAGGTLALVIWQRSDGLSPLDIAIGMAVVVIAAVWSLACTAERVRHHAEAYAVELFEAIETLVPPARGRAA